MLRLPRSAYLRMVGHALDGLPYEACGLLAVAAAPSAPTDAPAEGDDVVEAVYPCRNAAQSSKLYEVHSLDYLNADRDADAQGLRIAGVYHSHTHTDAKPSPTDLAQAPDPDWHYVIVSLRHPEPVVRSYRIVDGTATEEPLVVGGE